MVYQVPSSGQLAVVVEEVAGQAAAEVVASADLEVVVLVAVERVEVGSITASHF